MHLLMSQWLRYNRDLSIQYQSSLDPTGPTSVPRPLCFLHYPPPPIFFIPGRRSQTIWAMSLMLVSAPCIIAVSTSRPTTSSVFPTHRWLPLPTTTRPITRGRSQTVGTNMSAAASQGSAQRLQHAPLSWSHHGGHGPIRWTDKCQLQ